MKDYFNKLINQVKDFFLGIDYPNLTIKIFLIILGLLAIHILTKLTIFGFNKFFKYRHRENQRRKITIIKVITSLLTYIKYTVMFIYVLLFFNISTTALLTGIGALGLIVTFAFQDLIKDVVAGFFVLVENSYDVGDRVLINGVTGVVDNLSLKTTTIIPYAGEKVVFNNSSITSVTNYTNVGYAIISNTITVTFECDLEKFSLDIEEEIAKWHQKYSNIIEISYKGVTEIGPSGLIIGVDSKVQPLTQFQTKRDINIQLINFARKNGYPIAYNTIKLEGALDASK